MYMVTPRPMQRPSAWGEPNNRVYGVGFRVLRLVLWLFEVPQGFMVMVEVLFSFS